MTHPHTMTRDLPARLRKTKFIAALLGGCLLAGLSARADYDWTGSAGDGWYTNAANWTGTATDNNFIDTGVANYPTVNAAVSWNPNDLKIATKGGSLSTYTTGRVDVISGSLNVNYWTFIGDWAGLAYLNIANTAAGGGTYTGYGQGTGSFRAGALNGNGNIHIGLYGSTGVLNINTTGTNTASGLYIAPNNLSGSSGTFNLDNGTVNISGDMQVGSDFWGQGDTAAGYFNMSGGTVNIGNLFEVGHHGLNVNAGTDVATIAGGTLNVANDLRLGFAGNTGSACVMTITNGATVNVASVAARWVIIGQYDPIAVTMNIHSGSTLNLNAGTDIQFGTQNNSGARVLNVDGGTINGTVAGGSLINLQNSTTGGTSTMNIKNGGLVAADAILGGFTATLNFDNGTLKATASDPNFIGGGFTVNIDAGGATLDSNGKDSTVPANLGGTGGLTKIGNGTLRLNGANTYAGTTTVSQGSLGGTGTIASLVSVSAGAGFNFANGTAGDTLTLQNGLTLNTGNTMVFEVGAVSDQIAITGGAYTAPGSAVSVSISNKVGLTAGTYKLITGASGILLGQYTLATPAPTGYGWNLQVTGNDLELAVTVLAPTVAFWSGASGSAWTSPGNWKDADTGGSALLAPPSLPTDVTFSAAGAINEGTSSLNGSSFTINTLTFDASAGNVTIAGVGAETLTVNGGIANNSANTQVINAPLNLGGGGTIDTATANITLNSRLNASGMSKVGSGTLVLATALTNNTGDMSVNSGSLNITAGKTDMGVLSVPVTGSGGTSVYTQSGGTNTTTNLRVGQSLGNGTLAINAGQLSCSGTTRVGEGTGGTFAVGVMTVANGTFNSENDMFVGHSGDGSSSGTLNINSGGIVNIASTTKRWMMFGRFDSVKAVMNVNSGGVLNLNAGTDLHLEWTAVNHEITVNGGSILGTAATSPSYMALGHGTLVITNGGLVRLPGGCDAWDGNIFVESGSVLETKWLISGSPTAGNVYINGGTLRGTANDSGFINFWGAGKPYISSGGATIDTAGYTLPCWTGLLEDAASPGGGLTKVGNGTLFLNGANTYTGNTAVNAGLLGGSGTIAGTVTVAAGAGLAPGNGLGMLTVSSNLTFSAGSTNTFEVDGTTPTNDVVALGDAVTYGGVLKIATNGTFTAGQTFTLFSGAGATSASNFSSIQGSPGSGLAFSFTNGVLSVVTGTASYPTNITYSASGGSLSLSWPNSHLGWILQSQTNSASIGLSTNWFDVPGTAAVTTTNFGVNAADPAVFYRLRHP
jgi:autotransporter-associated beta strand protein